MYAYESVCVEYSVYMM